MDRQSKLKQLIDKISPNLAENLLEEDVERKVCRLKTKMSRSILSGDISAIAAMRDEIKWMHIDDCGYMLQATFCFNF